ncbi:MAG: diguanylate cyclase [Elusimicrobiota bacterium]
MTKKNVLIVGAGRRGLAAIEVFNEDSKINISGVVDKNSKAPGIKLAERIGIPTSDDWKKQIKLKSLPDALFNLTGDKNIDREINELALSHGFETMGEISSRLLDSLLAERQVQTEFRRVFRKIASDMELDDLLTLILSSCVKGTKSCGGLIALFEQDTMELKANSRLGLNSELEDILLKKFKERISSRKEKEKVEVLKIDNGKGFSNEHSHAVCATLFFKEKIAGAIAVTVSSQDLMQTGITKGLMEGFANNSSVAIENILLYKKFKRFSFTDALTGVFNYRHFQSRLDTELSRAQRYDLNFGLVIIDVDNFKYINDNYGHPEGDRVLKIAASMLKKNIRETDTLARYGGDEFVILLPETGKEGALTLAERIRRAFKNSVCAGKSKVQISLGVCSYPADGVYAEDLIKKADAALYKAKNKGKNRTCGA